MTLELKPEEETTLRSFADAEGITSDRFIARLIKGYQPSRGAVEPEWKTKLKASQQIMGRAFAASGISDDEMAADVDAEIKAHRAERALLESGNLQQPS